MKKTLQKEAIPYHISVLVETIVQAYPFHSNVLEKTLASLDASELQHFEDYLIFCLGQGLSIDYLATCYGTIIADVLRETVYFKEHKKYRYSSFSEVASNVYYNDTYMSLYMYGVLLTLFLWPNHLELLRFFCSTVPKGKQGTYLEIGPGHGYFLMTAMEHSAYTEFVAVDLSETSIRQTKALVDAKNTGKDVQFHCTDFLKFPLNTPPFDAIVMGEVLEHVEKPQDFLKKIATLAKKDAYIFITTCINSPQIDHIYLFKDTMQLEVLFSDCGLRIKKQCILPYVGKTIEECAEQFLAINVGYVLEKK